MWCIFPGAGVQAPRACSYVGDVGAVVHGAATACARCRVAVCRPSVPYDVGVESGDSRIVISSSDSGNS